MLYLHQAVDTEGIGHAEFLFPCKCILDPEPLLLAPFRIGIHNLVQNRPYVEAKPHRILAGVRRLQIAPVLHMNLQKLVKKIFGRIFGKYVDYARIDAEADAGGKALFPPLFMPVKIVFCHRLRVTALKARSELRMLPRYGPGSQIHVRRTCFAGRVKDIIAYKGRGGVHNKINTVFLYQAYQLRFFVRIHTGCFIYDSFPPVFGFRTDIRSLPLFFRIRPRPVLHMLQYLFCTLFAVIGN